MAEEAWKEIKDKQFNNRMQAEGSLVANAKKKESIRTKYVIAMLPVDCLIFVAKNSTVHRVMTKT